MLRCPGRRWALFVASYGARQLIPRWVRERIEVPVQGGHGARGIPDEDAGSGVSSAEDVELDEKDVEEDEVLSWCSLRWASRKKRSR